mmetsp:Transcript_25441/g.59573  ORF Transcript_25441/g.59573 Transcript_25441/m.59573 type:complete len:366 (+) Transcript_25441:401-1498(+)
MATVFVTKRQTILYGYVGLHVSAGFIDFAAETVPINGEKGNEIVPSRGCQQPRNLAEARAQVTHQCVTVAQMPQIRNGAFSQCRLGSSVVVVLDARAVVVEDGAGVVQKVPFFDAEGVFVSDGVGIENFVDHITHVIGGKIHVYGARRRNQRPNSADGIEIHSGTVALAFSTGLRPGIQRRCFFSIISGVFHAAGIPSSHMDGNNKGIVVELTHPFFRTRCFHKCDFFLINLIEKRPPVEHDSHDVGKQHEVSAGREMSVVVSGGEKIYFSVIYLVLADTAVLSQEISQYVANFVFGYLSCLYRGIEPSIGLIFDRRTDGNIFGLTRPFVKARDTPVLGHNKVAVCNWGRAVGVPCFVDEYRVFS